MTDEIKSLLLEFKRPLAIEFEVAEVTVERWANGTAQPHPRIWTQVVCRAQAMKK